MYPHQAERLQGALERQRLDALIAASPANVAYVTGFSSLARRVYPMLETYAVVTRDATALVVPTIDLLAVLLYFLNRDEVEVVRRDDVGNDAQVDVRTVDGELPQVPRR